MGQFGAKVVFLNGGAIATHLKYCFRIWVFVLFFMPLGLSSQVTPEIEVLTPDVCIPQPVRLRVKNCSGCTAFEWKIGSAAYQSGTDQYSTILTIPGTYDVSVIITTSSGLKFLISTTSAFKTHSPPAIRLSYNKRAVCGFNDTFVFRDSTPNSVSRDWLLESQLMNNGPRSISHVFSPVIGYKRVYMVVRDSWGCAASRLVDSFFGVWTKPEITPVVSSSAGCTPKQIRFSTIDNLKGQSLNYHKWWLPGANPDSIISSTPTVLFTRSDTFSYAAMVVTKQGCSAKVNMPRAILIGDSASLKIGTLPGDLCVKQKATFTVSGSKSGRPIWQFSGAGAFLADSSYGLKVRGGFSDTGLLNILVTETNRGCISTASVNKALRVKGPRAGFESLVTNYCAAPDTLLLLNTTAAVPVTTWKWTIFDSTGAVVHSSTSKDINRVVNDLNRFSARLIASSTNGCADTVYSKDVMVSGKLSAEYTISPNPTCPNQKVKLTPKAGKGSSRARNNFTWYRYNLNGTVAGVNNLESPEFTFASDGTYHSKLVIRNSRKCADSVFKKDSILVFSPEVTLSMSDSIICQGQSVWFYGARKKKYPGYTTYWYARHQDSSNVAVIGFGDSVKLKFRVPGPYRVSFNIYNSVDGSCNKQTDIPNRIKVSGSIFRSVVKPTFGCAPLTVDVSASVTADYNYSGNNKIPAYSWIRTPHAGFPVADTTAATFTSLIQGGKYFLSLAYSGKSGCWDTINPVLIESGVRSAIDVPFMGRCRGTPIQLLNNSSPWRDSLRYICDSIGVKFTPSNTHPSPQFVANRGGDFVVKLIVKYKTCSDTSSAIVRVEAAKASFYSADSITYCAPKMVQIFNTSPNAMISKWYFSNGDSTVSYGNDLVSNIFVRNNPRPGYDVKVLVQNYVGCWDTLFKKGYFRVIGPVPKLTLANYQGCEPLKVQFINNSTDYNRFLLDFGDGSVLDSIGGQFHTYRVTDKASLVQFFKPKMLVSDTFGCFALALPEDSVKVLKNAEAHFTFTSTRFLRKKEGCAGDLLVNFTDRSRFSVRNYWDFDGNDTIDIRNQPSPNYLYGIPGKFRPRLIAENLNGCKDTTVIDSVVVWEKPKPSFIANRDSFCARDQVKFTYNGTSAHRIVSYRWDFGEAGLLNDTSTLKDAKWKYQAPFDHPVSLRVVDSNGCTNTFIRGLYVLDTTGPARPEIAYISVRDDQYVDINWEKAGIGNFYRYHIYLDSTKFNYRFAVINREDTMRSLFKGSVLDNKRFCYAVRLEDTCSQIGKMSVSHCTILLRDTAKELYHLHLNWLSYDGWSTNLSHYEVFRKDPGGSFKRVGWVSASSQSYTDSFLCDQTYCYYVEAVHKNRVYRARSNEVCDKPIYRRPLGTSNITLVSVDNDSFPTVNWNSTYARIPGSAFVLERSTSGIPGSFGYVGAFNRLSARDPRADAHAAAYYYRVVFRDHCGNTGVPGSVSNSIFLQGIPGTGKVRVDWNKYDYWHSGVKEYKLQVRGRDHIYRDWVVLNPGQTEKDSIDLEPFALDTICFRVAAIKDSMPGDTSYSNSHCFIPGSYMWVPNGFSPDGNDLNETFRPISGYVFGDVSNPSLRYEFRIMNRWGQQVFYTNKPNMGWDGTLGGQPCQSGLYIYEVRAVGFDGMIHRQKGTIYLMR